MNAPYVYINRERQLRIQLRIAMVVILALTGLLVLMAHKYSEASKAETILEINSQFNSRR